MRGAIDFREDAVLEVEVRPELQRAVDEVRLRAAVPRLDRFAVDFLLVARLAEELGEVARLERAHPDGIPERRRIAQAHERALDFEIEADVRVAHGQARGDEADGLVDRARDELRVELGLLQRAEGIVAGEEFVAAIAAERDGDVLAGEAGEQIGRAAASRRRAARRACRRSRAAARRTCRDRGFPRDAACRAAPRRSGACALSSKLGSLKPMEKVLSWPAGTCFAASAAMAEESMPPLRKTPSGTSDMSRRCTARSSVARISSHSSSHREPVAVAPAPCSRSLPGVVRLEHELPIPPRLQLAAREIVAERVAAGQLPDALVDAARRGDVAVGEVFLERERREVARAARVLRAARAARWRSQRCRLRESSRAAFCRSGRALPKSRCRARS